MNALQPQRDPVPSSPSHRALRSRSRQVVPRSPHRVATVEIAMKLTVNVVFAAVAVSTLIKLIPYNHKQQAELENLQAEVEEATAKVAALQADFDRHFDPQQTVNVMQEQNIRFNPKQRQVVWLAPDSSKAKGSKLSDADQQAEPLFPAKD